LLQLVFEAMYLGFELLLLSQESYFMLFFHVKNGLVMRCLQMVKFLLKVRGTQSLTGNSVLQLLFLLGDKYGDLGP
jgi:hypothetical protein